MLRGAVLLVAGLAAAAGLAALVSGAFPPALILGLWAILILAGTICERVRYKPVMRQPPGPPWRRTPERFIDPQSGLPVSVYVRDASGERLYVQE